MSQLIFSALLSTWATTAPILGSAFIILFEIVLIMGGLDYDGINTPTLGSIQNSNQR
jgi:hypothetical protein